MPLPEEAHNDSDDLYKLSRKERDSDWYPYLQNWRSEKQANLYLVQSVLC